MPVSEDGSVDIDALRILKVNGPEEDGEENPTEEQRQQEEEAHEEESDGESWTGSSNDDDEEEEEDDRMLDNQQLKVSLASHGGADGKSPLWKLDPEESFSDWTIYISKEGGGGGAMSQRQTRQHEEQQQDDVYHVHRTILTCGLLQSDYFRMLFQSNFCETKSNSCRIPLPEPARMAFPLFLNLFYHPFTSLKDIPAILLGISAQPDYLGTEVDDDDTNKKKKKSSSSHPPSSYKSNLVAMLYLADFFQATQLHDAIFKVIQQEEVFFPMFPSLYQQAAIHFSPPVQIVVDYMQGFCAKNILKHQVYMHKPFWNMVSVDFVVEVVSSEHHLIKGRGARTIPQNKYVPCLVTETHRSTHLSWVVAEYCWNHSQQQQQNQSGVDDENSLVTPETFRILTQKDYLPHLMLSAAWKLLQLEKYYHDLDNESKTTAASSSTTSGGEDGLTTCLQKRCLDAFLNHHAFIHTSNPSDETLEIFKSYKTLLSASAIVDFMSKLCNKKVKKQQKAVAELRQKEDALQREVKRFKLLPAREALTMGINDDEDGDDPRFIKPVQMCAPEKFLPEHLHNGRDHTEDGRCPGHVLTKDRKRVLFTYEPASDDDMDLDNDEEEEEDELEDNEDEEEEEELEELEEELEEVLEDNEDEEAENDSDDDEE